MTDVDSGEVTVKLTRKYAAADPLARQIVTAYLDEHEYQLLTALPADALSKRRYACEGYSLDIFEGPLLGLELVEIEASDDDALAAIACPAWTVREVSYDEHYQGGSLAHHGIPEEAWPRS